MSSAKIFEQTIQSMIDKNSEIKTYYANGPHLFERCDWNYDIINCSDCNKEYRFRCHDKYELLYKVWYTYSEVGRSIDKIFKQYNEKFNKAFDKDHTEIMKMVIDKYVNDTNKYSDNSWENLWMSWGLDEDTENEIYEYV